MPTAGGWVVDSSSQGDCGFQLPEEVFDLVVLGGGGLGDLDEALLDDVVAVCGGGGPVVEVGVKICRQVNTIRETREGAVGRGIDKYRIGVGVVEELDGDRCDK